MSSFRLNDSQIAEWTKRYREAAAPYVTGEVEAAGPFQRAGQTLLLIPVIGQLGAIFYFLYQAINKKRAGGLPANFLLVVTPTEVHALKYRTGRGSINVKGEVGVWKRSDIVVTNVVDGPASRKVTFTVTENGQTSKIVCSASSLGSNPWSSSVIDALRPRSVAAAA